MKFWKFDWFTWLVSFVFTFLFLFFFYVSSFCLSGASCGYRSYLTSFVCFDVASMYLIFLTVVISVCVLFLKPWMSNEVFCVVLISQFSSMLSYVCCHAVLFWVFYEVSIICLMFLLLKDSPYSERYTAFWYFSCYLLCCSLPMLIIFLFLSFESGSFSVFDWDLSLGDNLLLFFLGTLFMTKIPLFPFQAWLPVVHAESSSVVSVCLSGYIMKLGVLGIFRFCSWIAPGELFYLEYVGFSVLLGLLYVVCASFELDSKRWLAFLSLAHISMIPLCLGVTQGDDFNVSFSYCLGHGLSSSLAFILFWFLSSAAGGRSWYFLKEGLGSSLVWRVLVVLCFCLCGSIPFCLQFFVELNVLCWSSWYVGFVFYSLCLFLFFSGLIPLVCLGSLLVRHRSVSPCLKLPSGPLLVLVFLAILNFSSFLIF